MHRNPARTNPNPNHSPAAQTEKAVTEAFKAGYRHVDSAALYRNEAACGNAIRKAAQPPLSIPRSDIFFTSKVLSQPGGGATYESTRAQVDRTLAETKLAYIDLMLLHAPYGGPAARKGAWLALVEAVEAGKVRSIGVSNYGVHHLAELEKHMKQLEAERQGKGGGVLSVGQWEVHPWCARGDIVDWCKKRGVAVQAYCPLVHGARWGEPGVRKLAKKYGKSEAQVMLRWALEKGLTPLPKSVTPSRIRENSELFGEGFALTKEEVDGLETDEYSPVCWDPTRSSLRE
ncbi:aldo-keto reductase [Bombardia bombarda]|uniref:Aldo-keto reductase n=1 Tax=Bombardia bombarda TaxID=252184 RepID=A0AA39XP17_9PEZI|nr:aldo-keto reductase [Bombardia bombarda]